MRARHEQPAPLRALDDDRVIWTGSFSMTTFPGLRVGYLVAPPQLVDAFVAAKAGVVQLTKTLAVAWARHGIRVNAVAPGVIDTPMTAPMAEFPELLYSELAHTPMGRLGTPQEIAGVVQFLASSAASFITGHVLVADGGYLLP